MCDSLRDLLLRGGIDNAQRGLGARGVRDTEPPITAIRITNPRWSAEQEGEKKGGQWGVGAESPKFEFPRYGW